MRIIEADFDRLDNIPFSELARAVGVYVIWDGHSMTRPSYVGEGVILARLASHVRRFVRPFDGYVAIFGDLAESRAKTESEVVEALLLEVARETDRHPGANRVAGKTTSIAAIFRSHGTLRVKVVGFDPLARPWHARPLPQAKQIVLKDHDGSWLVEHDWRRRPLQR